MQQDENSLSVANTKSLNQIHLDEKSRDVSPLKATSSVSASKLPSCSDTTWNNYIKMSNDEKGANQLRVDSDFLDKLLTVLSGNAG